MSERKASAVRVAEAHFWNRGPKGHSLRGNRKYLLEADARMAEKFRDGVAEYVVKKSPKVDPDNKHPAKAWRDGGDGLYVFANSRIGGHPAMEFAIKIPSGPFLQFGYGGNEGIQITEQRSGKSLDIPHPLPDTMVNTTDVAEFLLKKMADFTVNKDNWGQPGSAMPI